MKVRYYKLLKLLKKNKITLSTLRIRLRLPPTEIAKIETNRLISNDALFLICEYFGCDTCDVMDIFLEEERDLFENGRILEAHSYPLPQRTDRS